jgi:hypothetical protein
MTILDEAEIAHIGREFAEYAAAANAAWRERWPWHCQACGDGGVSHMRPRSCPCRARRWSPAPAIAVARTGSIQNPVVGHVERVDGITTTECR